MEIATFLNMWIDVDNLLLSTGKNNVAYMYCGC